MRGRRWARPPQCRASRSRTGLEEFFATSYVSFRFRCGIRYSSHGSRGRSSVKSRVRPLHLAHGPIPQGGDAAARAGRSGLAALRRSRALAYGNVRGRLRQASRVRRSCAWLSRGVQDIVLPPPCSFPQATLLPGCRRHAPTRHRVFPASAGRVRACSAVRADTNSGIP
jgi:hypothetical protein